MGFAGSAREQNVGDLTNWKKWKPSNLVHCWLLIAGATSLPEKISTSDRRSKEEKSGKFLEGTKYDMQAMEEFVRKEDLGNLQNSIRDFEIEKNYVSQKIEKFFALCKQNNFKPVLYYTGHGEVGTGNWCFNDGTLSIGEIEALLPGGAYYPLIIADCCYSGHWANHCLDRNEEKNLGFHCLSASPEYSTAKDRPTAGGELTMWMTGKLECTNISTVPLYSGGNRNKYSFVQKIDIVDFIEGQIMKTEFYIQSQCLFEDRYCVIFAKYSNGRPARSWSVRISYENMIKYIKEELWGKKQYVRSITADNDKFVIYGEEDYGINQAITTWKTETEEYWSKGYRITSCFPYGTSFYFVMTKDAPGYPSSRSQQFCTRQSWRELKEAIEKHWKDGKIITDISHSKTSGEYIAIMTSSEQGQKYAWDINDCDSGCGYTPTVIFKDPLDKKVLYVQTTNASNGWKAYEISVK